MGEAFLVFLTILGGIVCVICMIGGVISSWRAGREGRNYLAEIYRYGWDDIDDDKWRSERDRDHNPDIEN